MGGKWSKSSIVGWPKVWERIQQTPPAATGVGAVSRDLERHGAISSSNTNHPSCALAGSTRRRRGGRLSSQATGASKTNDLQGSFGSQPLFKRKGGTWMGIIYSRKRQEILDLWVYNTQGFFPDWHNYTPGPGIRYPLTFGWCFKLVPVDPEEVERANEGENNSLLHPICQHGMDDEERETLMWKFDSRLAFAHPAREKHPEYYKDC
uniref:Protein Nef n=1 Tax=Human immunodeficiency virus type 1 TaxID=11676 RepID=Q5U6R8_HV1|nr:nef protein [Human immunodeficiency virus 1]